MTLRTPENPWVRKTRFLTQILILSGTLNIGLLATFIYVVLKEKHESYAIELKPVKQEQPPHKELTNAQILKAYSLLPYQELLLRLENKELIEEGLCKRDLALSCLCAFHHFNLEKALSGAVLQKRSLPFTNAGGEEKIEIPVFPGLSDDQFLALSYYAKTEKWPLTSQGLFYELKRSPLPYDPSLVDSFCHSAEFETMQTLFSKTGLPLSQDTLIRLLCEGEWKTLIDFIQAQRFALDLSVESRRSFLFGLLDCRSALAAKLLLETDLEFVFKRCDDAHFLTLLDLADPLSPHLLLCAKGLLASPRTDVVWKRVAEILYASAEEKIPEPFDHNAALKRFFPQPIAEAAAPQIVPAPEQQSAVFKNPKKMYIVENGDSLWKISRKFHVSIEEIMRANHLESERLRPGKQLEIPVKHGDN